MNNERTLSIRAALASLLMLFSFAAAGPLLAQEQQDGNLPLWEVTHQGNTVYLMGSVHLLRPEVYPLDDALYEAFDAAQVVAFELDFEEMMAAAPMMMQRGMYTDGRTLRDVLPAELYADLERRAGEAGLPMAMVERMKPWMVSLTLSSLIMQRAGFEAASGIDLHFHERAKAAGRTIIGLETMEDQIRVFDALDDAAQVAFLRSTLEQLDDTVAQLDAATAYWRRGDTEGLAEMFTESMGDQPVLMERLLYERNRNWIPQIEALLRTPETAIVIVGMGHLVGEQSVIDLLEERGYTVRRWNRVPAAAGAGR